MHFEFAFLYFFYIGSKLLYDHVCPLLTHGLFTFRKFPFRVIFFFFNKFDTFWICLSLTQSQTQSRFNLFFYILSVFPSANFFFGNNIFCLSVSLFSRYLSTNFLLWRVCSLLHTKIKFTSLKSLAGIIENKIYFLIDFFRSQESMWPTRLKKRD